MKGLKGILAFAIIIFGAAVLLGQTPEWEWAVSAGGTGSDHGESIAVDNQGNQYVTGYFNGTASFGDITLTSSGSEDIFVCKLDPDGNFLWTKKAGGIYQDKSNAIAVDSAGNSYVTGCFQGTASYGAITLTSNGSFDIFVCKLDANGNLLWAVNAGGSVSDHGSGIAVDSAGNQYVTGSFSGTANFGSTMLTSIGGDDIFVCKLDSNGNFLWAVQAGGTGEYDYGRCIAVDSTGNSHVIGSFLGTASFGDITLTSNGWEDIFVCKLDANGNLLWAVNAGGSVSDHGSGIAVDSAGNSYVTGWFEGSASFGATNLTSSGYYDIFVCKLDTNGNFLWAQQAGGTSIDGGYGIAVDNAGNSYVTGSFEGTASFGDITLTSSGGMDIFVCKLDNAGNFLWAKNSGDYEDSGFGIAVDNDGNQHVTGYFSGTASFGTTTLTSSGGYDIFIAILMMPFSASFNADITYGPEPLSVQFTDQSTQGPYQIINWYWNFGDGNLSAEQNPIHVYNEPGVYTVSLTIIDEIYQSSTFARPDYITVVEQVHAVELLSEEQLSFGDVWLEEESPWQPVILSNTGNVDLNVSDAHFIADPLHFELSEPFTGLIIPPGEVDSLLVRFAPQGVGALSDTLYIVNDSDNLPLIAISLSGTGQYVPPKPPENVQIVMDGNNAVVTWDAVTQNMHNEPITPDYYLVFYCGSSDPDTGPYYYLAWTPNLTYTHDRVGLHAQHMFYHVLAYKYYGRGSFEALAAKLTPGMTQAEVMALLP